MAKFGKSIRKYVTVLKKCEDFCVPVVVLDMKILSSRPKKDIFHIKCCLRVK